MPTMGNRSDDKNVARAWALAEILRRKLASGDFRAAVTSTSMGPLARRGDTFLIEPLAAAGPRFGDVVLAIARGRAITHRLVGRRRSHYLLKGDGAPAADEPLPREHILGQVQALIKEGGRVISFQDLRGRALGVSLALVSRAEAAAHSLWPSPAEPARKFFYLAARAVVFLFGA